MTYDAELKFRLLNSAKKELEKIAETEHLDVSDIARKAIREYLERTKLLRAAEEPPAYGQRQSQSQSARAIPRVETDAKGLVTAINPAFRSMCGYSLAKLRGRKPGAVLQGAGTEPEAVHTMRRAIRQRRPCAVSLTNYHKDGSPYRVRIEMRPMFHGRRLTGFEADETRLPE